MTELCLVAGTEPQSLKFKTSQKVTIIGADGSRDIQNAIVRSYNPSNGEYYLTYRDENQLIRQIFVDEERIRG